jgi:hypothetical protein
MLRTVATICLLLLPGVFARGEEKLTAAEQQRLSGEIGRLMGDLDSDRFEVRRSAAARLEEMAAQPELGRLLSGEFKRALLRPDISFEVRWHLERWSRRLPEAPAEPVADASPEELDRLVRQLDDDSYAVRLGAAQRLQWLTNNPKLVCPLMLRLKQRLAVAAPAANARGELEKAWQRARGAWLLSDPAGWQLPAVADEQMQQWVDELPQPAPAGEAAGRWQVHRVAERELLDLLARDEYLPRVAQLLKARLAQGLDADAAARLRAVLDLTRPEMVAEYWQGRRHLSEQHLLVGVPTMSPGAVNPSHFDPVDERTAHCVSGNSLSPGDYPVGVAFPHPRQEGAVFHLVYLPTPRRRMAYTHYVQTDEAKRLAAISRRTLDRMLENKRLLSEPELVMLGQLDAAEVSRFAGKYFSLVDDGQLPDSGMYRLGGRPSRFGMICAQLAVDGTKDAMPGLADAMAKRSFLPPTSLAPHRLHWLAALSIAARDPWPEVEAWLAGCIGESEILVEGRPSGAEVGATAAVVLLNRHGRSLSAFDLTPAADPLMARLHVDGYRFSSEEARKRVQQWWQQEREKKQTP